MKISTLEFTHGIFLAPMAGVTDIPFRRMCKEYGAECVCTEMVSSRALCYKDEKTALLAKINDDEHPCALQIFGNEPEIMAKAAILALKFKPDIIDINMGCPAPKIAGNGDGSALMKKPLLAYETVKAVKEAISGKNIPLTVKIRSGFDKDHINAVEVAQLCEKAGADAITVHARTREQMYSPPIDIDIIKNVKEAVSIPVIGNGDITSAEDAVRMLEYTGCDGIMVGRGALGNPYIFEEISSALEGKNYTPPSSETRLSDVVRHMTSLIEYKGEYIGSREARKHISWYLRGIKGAAGYRDEVNRATSLKAILDIVNRAFSQQE